MSESFGQKLLVAVISVAVGSVITGGVSIYLNAKTEDQMRTDTENAVVQALADEFGDITRDMEFDEAIGQMKKDIDDLRKDKEKLEKGNTDLEKMIVELNKLPKVEYNSIGVVLDGLKIEDGIEQGWATIDGKNYYSEDLVNSLFESKVYLDKETKSLFYDTAGTSNLKETKVALEDTEVLYEGDHYRIYKSPGPDTITLGSTQYKTGFTLSPKYGYPGKALFDLGGNYSKICFDVGRVTGAYTAKTNDISVYLGEEIVEKIEINPNVVSKHVEIPLKYASEMMIKASTSHLDGTSFGFVNVILEY